MLSRKDLENIASLAKLKIPEEKFSSLLSDMKNVIEFADSIEKVNLTKEAFSEKDSLENRFRSDEIVNSFDQSEILGNCQTVEEGFFRLSLNSEGGGPEVD